MENSAAEDLVNPESALTPRDLSCNLSCRLPAIVNSAAEDLESPESWKVADSRSLIGCFVRLFRILANAYRCIIYIEHVVVVKQPEMPFIPRHEQVRHPLSRMIENVDGLKVAPTSRAIQSLLPPYDVEKLIEKLAFVSHVQQVFDEGICSEHSGG
ncbi:hypothetical protein SDJN02_25700, partial [Cucurbita argyrosperma subsp. argyrosperma]